LSKKRRNMQLGSLAIVVGTVLVEMVCGVPYATTRYGKLQGFNYEMKTGTEAKVFLGIPYALPPTGDLRYEVCTFSFYSFRNLWFHGFILHVLQQRF
uniref:COesterase domain-containing protein n=1 Tax=Anisakis simplex TaxID=6269 RepID=A0A0M3JKL7_ANISI